MSVLDRIFVYHPYAWEDRNWARSSGLPLEDVWFKAEDGTKLFGWYVESSSATPVVLWCHGNAGNITHRLENLRELYRIGLSVFLFDYRGYGKSEGLPSEDGLYMDAMGAYQYLIQTRRIPHSRVVLFGRSLGGAVAGEVAARKPASCLILESCFPSIEAVAKYHYRGLPVHWLLSSSFRLADRLPVLSLPKLFVHGDRDEIIPVVLGDQVFQAAKPPKEFYVVKGADHNDLPFVGGRPYFSKLHEFIASTRSK
jgi:fermentation-respiration switch protein FrsA (DUF1100 family)